MSSTGANKRLAGTRRALAILRDDLALTYAMSEAANESGSLEEVLAEALEMICEHMGWAVGHALSVDRASASARSTEIWQLPPLASFEPLRAATDQIEAFPLADRAIREQTPMLLHDLGAHQFGRLAVTSALGLHHYYVLPILSGDIVVAALEFLTAKPDPRGDEALTQLLANLGMLLGRVAEREARAEQRVALRHSARARKEAEARARALLRVTKELQQRNRELDQFTYAASHDLRAPLRGIANLAGWLASDLEPHLTDDTRRYLDLLEGRVKRMEALIDGLLAYSRLGRAAVPDERIDVTALVRELAELHDVDGVVEWRISDLPEITGPRLLLRQVLDNLLSNAIKHTTAARPHVSVWAERDEPAEAWRLFVRDNGPGIDPRYHERIWEIFQTLRPRDEVESTGIGLSLVLKIVRQRGGSVGLDSQLGAGATFHFTWPDRAPDQAPEAST
ncbi:sensor histidine kinase [Enhygromyxa salina]|uniref:histidine kinase n=1 Tax=Enhygromyxa salina TaxID=215803 RepID=A0A2S9YJX8_9BACT|nr:ATP-binding protein [Enhygromyxa salina]PRQ05409.1 Phytochrome-like protein cph1 [Enhygromyxa salina]